MSLINDALKRAKEAQEHAPPSALSAAHLRPVEPKHSARHAAGLLLPIVLTLVALGGLFFLWQAAQINSPEPAASPRQRPASANPMRSAAPPPAPTAVAATAPSPAVSVPRVPAPDPTAPVPNPVVDAPKTNAAVVAASAPAVTAPASAATPSAATNLLALAQVTTPTPAALRLQAIVFHPTRPSAMVNGKTVFVGDRLGDYRVLAIGHDSATLAAPTRTNVLSLAE